MASSHASPSSPSWPWVPKSSKVTPDPWLTPTSSLYADDLVVVAFHPDGSYVKDITRHMSVSIRVDIVQKQRFSSGEWNIQLPASVRRREVFAVWRVEADVNADIMALKLLVQACVEGGAATVHVLARY